MLTIVTREQVTYRLDYRDLDGSGQRLTLLREEGPDDDDVIDHSRIDPGRWYLVDVLEPLPPRAGEAMTLVLHERDQPHAPVIRRTTSAMSVVGTL